MATARHSHTATILPDGDVLVAGGRDASTTFTSAERYDAVSRTWSPAGSMAGQRERHTATLLPNGNVLVVAGQLNGNSLATAELYDPDTNTWTSAANIPGARRFHTATLLTSGKVLVSSGVTSSSPQLYDPALNTWSGAGTQVLARFDHSATLLANGQVLLAGGASTVAGAELYDPGTNSWSAATSMATGRHQHTGHTASQRQRAGRWWLEQLDHHAVECVSFMTHRTNIMVCRREHWSLPAGSTQRRSLANGHVLVAGGVDAESLGRLYDPTLNTWTATAFLTSPRFLHAAMALPDNTVLATGGTNGVTVWATSEIHTADPSTLIRTRSLIARQSHTAPQQTRMLTSTTVRRPPTQRNSTPTATTSTTAPRMRRASTTRRGPTPTPPATRATPTQTTTASRMLPRPGARPALRPAQPRYLWRATPTATGSSTALSVRSGSIPASAASKPAVAACAAAGDPDGDKVQSRLEVCFYNSNPNAIDTDSDVALDGAKDGCELPP